MKSRFIQALFALRSDKRGVTIIEYAMLAALVAVALATSLSTLSGKVSNTFATIGSSL